MEHPRFAEWWDCYPKRLNRHEAAIAYARAVREVGPDLLLSALRAQLPRLLEEDSRFVALPQNWLGKRRWTDEVESDRPVRQSDVVPDNPIPDYEAAWVRPTFGGAS